ncbi:hypothetical protein QQ045_004557 [Rhodiola kirilowii]
MFISESVPASDRFALAGCLRVPGLLGARYGGRRGGGVWRRAWPCCCWSLNLKMSNCLVSREIASEHTSLACHVATGFGNHLARPILRAKWHKDLSFEEAVKLLEECMRVLIHRDRFRLHKSRRQIYPPYSLKL